MTNTRNILTIIALSALGLCLFMTLAKMAMKGDKRKKACDNVCGMLVFIAAVLLAVAQFMEDSKPEKFHQGKPHGSGDKKEVLILSAMSFCGYCKKIHANKDDIKKALKNHGIDLKYVSDTENKAEFEKLQKKYKVKGFPASIVLQNGKEMGRVAGYMPTQQFTEKVVAQLN